LEYLSNPLEKAKKIRSAMNQNTEKWVKLNKSNPVLIVYFTSRVDNDRRINFRG
jgi:murein L,D-transpeptidase YcbB/YkuD